jgi:hypothetical protein
MPRAILKRFAPLIASSSFAAKRNTVLINHLERATKKMPEQNPLNRDD